jgi:hypothetical protein
MAFSDIHGSFFGKGFTALGANAIPRDCKRKHASDGMKSYKYNVDTKGR